MLDGIEKLVTSLEEFDAQQEVQTIIENNADYLVELMQQQLAAGIDITGNERVDEYRPFTIKYKLAYGEGLGAIVDRVTFFMTGDLYAAMQARITEDEFEIIAPAEQYKYDKMLERIGDENFGLDEESLLKFGEERLLPAFNDVLKLTTGLEISEV
jgi:hypothetical protein